MHEARIRKVGIADLATDDGASAVLVTLDCFWTYVSGNYSTASASKAHRRVEEVRTCISFQNEEVARKRGPTIGKFTRGSQKIRITYVRTFWF